MKHPFPDSLTQRRKGRNVPGRQSPNRGPTKSVRCVAGFAPLRETLLPIPPIPGQESVLTIETRHPGFEPHQPMPRSLWIGFEDAMDPVMIRHDPDPRLEPAEGRAEARSQNPKGLLMVSMVRTDPFHDKLLVCVGVAAHGLVIAGSGVSGPIRKPAAPAWLVYPRRA